MRFKGFDPDEGGVLVLPKWMRREIEESTGGGVEFLLYSDLIRDGMLVNTRSLGIAWPPSRI